MNWAHVHLALNHVPVVGVFGIALLLIIALYSHNTGLARLTSGLLVLLAIVTVVVYLTGGAAEELVEGLPDVSEPMIEYHEEVALVGTIVVIVAGIVALGPLLRWSSDQRISTRTLAAVLVVTLIACGIMAYTANTGGRIRHTEIRSGAALSDSSIDQRPTGARELDRASDVAFARC